MSAGLPGNWRFRKSHRFASDGHVAKAGGPRQASQAIAQPGANKVLRPGDSNLPNRLPRSITSCAKPAII